MAPRLRLSAIFFAAAAALTAPACGDSGDDTATSSHPDDGGSDASTDATESDSGSDASLDSGDDATDAADSESEAGDAETDAGDDAGADAETDAAANPCTTCHGSAANAAPPKDTTGGTATTLASVGAHQTHLVNPSIYRLVECTDCHVVPQTVGDPGHIDGLPAELTFGAVASADQVTPKYENGKCSVYCHGVSLPGGTLTSPIWTKVDGTQVTCGGCHAIPPAAPHPKLATLSCSPCHSGWNGLMPTNPSLHVDGKLQVQACGGCHAMPPATGAHAAHYGDQSTTPLADYGDTRALADYYSSGASYYMYGCGNCHPLDSTKHADGTVQVELHDTSAPSGSLKARSPSSASYASGKCSDVYCHSSGQAAPAYVTTPTWNGGKLPTPRCAACHGNPPDYPSGGAGSATANTHLVMADDGYELGHFGGMPGPWHTSYHGGTTESAAPITCQTCHFDTVDPANVGPGGFYYLDTTGDYDLGGSLGFSCTGTTCHSGQSGAPAQKSGAVLPLKHVNGQRDVAFDPRTSIPSNVTGLPAAPNRPTYPYWVTATPSGLPPSSTTNGVTWSLNLAASSYDPTTKTCSKVPCHLKQSFGTGKPQYDPLRWGKTPVGNASCDDCHQFM